MGKITKNWKWTYEIRVCLIQRPYAISWRKKNGKGCVGWCVLSMPPWKRKVGEPEKRRMSAYALVGNSQNFPCFFFLTNFQFVKLPSTSWQFAKAQFIGIHAGSWSNLARWRSCPRSITADCRRHLRYAACLRDAFWFTCASVEHILPDGSSFFDCWEFLRLHLPSWLPKGESCRRVYFIGILLRRSCSSTGLFRQRCPPAIYLFRNVGIGVVWHNFCSCLISGDCEGSSVDVKRTYALQAVRYALA